MATSVAIRQDRDADAVKRLMTGRSLVPVVLDAEEHVNGTTTTQKPASGVPFTCYRCGQPLQGSLEDYSHPCLSNVEHMEDRPVKERHDLVERPLAHEPRGPTLSKAQLRPSTDQGAVAATPSGILRAGRDEPREPRPLEQVRADLVKRGLDSADIGGSKRRRLTTDSNKKPGLDAAMEENRPRTHACPIMPPMHGAIDAQDAHVADDLDDNLGTTLIKQRPPPSMKQAVLPSVVGPVCSVVVAEEQEDTAGKGEMLPKTQRQTTEHEGEIAKDLPAHTGSDNHRRSRRGSTQAASKAAASLAYQEKHKAKIAREIQRCAAQPNTTLHSKSPTHGTSLQGKTNDDTFGGKESSTDGQYEVEIVKAFRRNRCEELEYLVIWKGYPASDATWEPAANLADLEPELFAFTPPVSTTECIDEARIRPIVRGAGELNNSCRRCQCLGCGTRRFVKKADTTRHPLQQEGKRGAHCSSTYAEPVASGYSGSSSWPVELLGPKPRPPYGGRVPVAATSNSESRKNQQDSWPTVTSRPPGVDTSVATHIVRTGATEMDATASEPRQLPLNNLPAAVVQSLRGVGPCDHLEKGKLPAGWYAFMQVAFVHLPRAMYPQLMDALSFDFNVATALWQDSPRPVAWELGSHAQHWVDTCYASTR